jgi:putative copper resistance protein D
MLSFWRALHFAAMVQATGVTLFCAYGLQNRWPQHFGHRLRLIFWISLMLALASGAAWLLALAASIADASWTAAAGAGTTWELLTGTQFGQAWLVRLVAALILFALSVIAWPGGLATQPFGLVATLVFASGVAFAGHAASVPGPMGNVHLAADILHLIAVSAWLGGLLPYALLLRDLQKENPQDGLPAIRDVTLRFSNVGLAAVLTILVTGLVNTINLVGSVQLLTHTEYGRLLTVKIILFVAMVAVAGINRLALTPRLSLQGTVDQLQRNIMIETALGIFILCIVAVLGTMPPALVDYAGM